MKDSLTIREKKFIWGQKTYLMGILNVTPDSFSDGGKFNNIDAALSQAETMINSGVDIIDVGGQSTRPGAITISETEELNRVIPTIATLRKISSIPISIDTTRASVAKAAVEVGADIINDISGATFDEKMLATVAKLQVPIILMHMRGNPQTMQQLNDYEDLIGEIYKFLTERISMAVALGIKRSHIIIDPGIGFAKNHQQNIQLLRHLSRFKSLNIPILIGLSRKSFIGHILNKNNPEERVWGTGAACSAAINYGCDILRVHDVSEMYDVARVADAIFRVN